MWTLRLTGRLSLWPYLRDRCLQVVSIIKARQCLWSLTFV
jgi:hypothetical protein